MVNGMLQKINTLVCFACVLHNLIKKKQLIELDNDLLVERWHEKYLVQVNFQLGYFKKIV